jgi:hypothetical protein
MGLAPLLLGIGHLSGYSCPGGKAVINGEGD